MPWTASPLPQLVKQLTPKADAAPALHEPLAASNGFPDSSSSVRLSARQTPLKRRLPGPGYATLGRLPTSSLYAYK